MSQAPAPDDAMKPADIEIMLEAGRLAERFGALVVVCRCRETAHFVGRLEGTPAEMLEALGVLNAIVASGCLDTIKSIARSQGLDVGEMVRLVKEAAVLHRAGNSGTVRVTRAE
jgi:hypothetical protein